MKYAFLNPARPLEAEYHKPFFAENKQIEVYGKLPHAKSSAFGEGTFYLVASNRLPTENAHKYRGYGANIGWAHKHEERSGQKFIPYNDKEYIGIQKLNIMESLKTEIENQEKRCFWLHHKFLTFEAPSNKIASGSLTMFIEED